MSFKQSFNHYSICPNSASIWLAFISMNREEEQGKGMMDDG